MLAFRSCKSKSRTGDSKHRISRAGHASTIVSLGVYVVYGLMDTEKLTLGLELDL